MTLQRVDRLLDAWFGSASRVLQPGRGFCIWSGYANCGNSPPFLQKDDLYFGPAIRPFLTCKDTMGTHVTGAGFAWERGLLAKN